MKSILESHTVTDLKKEISKTNIKGYSKMKKDDVIKLMLKNKERFNHIKTKEVKPRAKPTKPAKPVKKEVKKVIKKQEEEVLKYKPSKLIPISSATKFLWKVFRKTIKEGNVSEEAEKRKRWMISKMQDEGYETKEWLQDFIPFMNELRKKGDFEKQYQESKQ